MLMNLSFSLVRTPPLPHNLAAKLSHKFDIPIQSDLEAYLGMPILHGRLSRHFYEFFISKVKKHLSGLKQNTLSWAARMIIQSSTSTIPYYAMQTSHMLAFDSWLWEAQLEILLGRTRIRKEDTHCRAGTICRAKGEGGVGMKNLSHMNMGTACQTCSAHVGKTGHSLS